ncbi:putative sporulation-specific protein [Septoria linicola]|nr:putative sporulation-specific protein [Septoria linicola]
MSRMHHQLAPESHTARRLEHATPEHLNQTTRRVFIGPIPEGWLKSHRKEWYKQYIGSRGKRTPTFTAAARPLTATNAIVTHDGAGSRRGHGAGNVLSSEEAPRLSSVSGDVIGGAAAEGPASTTSLLHSQNRSIVEAVEQPDADADANAPGQGTSGQHAPPGILQEAASATRLNKVASKLPVPKVRFTDAGKLQLRARASRLAARGNFRHRKIKHGEMMKVDKMLVRIDITQQSLREDYDEKVSQSVVTKSMDKWREFMVVCRSNEEEDAQAVLQFYQTRVINVSEGEKVKTKPKIQILLGNSKVRVNLYSSLDKTLCLWTTQGARTTIYYLRAASGATAVEWYTFLRGVLGHKRAESLQVNIPDLSVSLRLDDPFRALEASQTLADAADGDEDALLKAYNEEKGAAGAIVTRCMAMLKENSEWQDVLKVWAQEDRIGLAWKRYDRLEWLHGAVEQRMYGTIAMQRTHDLELRPKDHYPKLIKHANGPDLEEPAPVEGFLIRLTSQKGKEQRLGKMLFKRLYFTTQNQYLLFTRPAKAMPPPPPKMSTQANAGDVPSTREISAQVPLAYDVEPYPLHDHNISWLDTQGIMSAAEVHSRDAEAAAEAERNVEMLLECDGFIDMCNVHRVRNFFNGASPADENLEEGDDVDFHVQVPDTRQDDGATTEVDEDRVFELVMRNGLVIRLQAFNKATRDQWVKRMRQLVLYWTLRKKSDMDLYKSTREQNLRELGIDERAEAVVGQFAYKWEVGKSFASPTLYNMCGISECRTIHLSGVLFRKPRKHTTFERNHVILSHGHLLIFQDTLRKRTGQKLQHIHHERIASIDLKGCYLYSGLLTENDLLYQNQTFDSNTPGHHALPRIYLEDGWTSTDEDAMTTFVIWHANSNSWFKSSSTVDDRKIQQQQADEDRKVRTKLTRVSKLGATGRSVVFKARSRAERDHWVLAIQVEIERLASQSDEVRLVDDGKKTEDEQN